MKNPLIVLAVCAITTFTMGWFGHRVFSKTKAKAAQQQANVPQPVNKPDTNRVLLPDTLLAQKADSNSKPLEETSPSPVILASSKNDTLWNDENEMVVKAPDGTVEIKRRFKWTKTFKDFAAEKQKIKRTPPLDYSTSKYAKLYKGPTKKTVENGPNFADRFAFASIDCGEGCFSCTITDLKTGKVYDGPHASGGYLFKLNSRLLIVNPPPPDGFYEPCELCEPLMFVWTGKEFKKIKQ